MTCVTVLAASIPYTVLFFSCHLFFLMEGCIVDGMSSPCLFQRSMHFPPTIHKALPQAPGPPLCNFFSWILFFFFVSRRPSIRRSAQPKYVSFLCFNGRDPTGPPPLYPAPVLFPVSFPTVLSWPIPSLDFVKTVPLIIALLNRMTSFFLFSTLRFSGQP